MANREGVLVLKRLALGLAPHGGAVRLEPGEYPFTIMDGDDDIATLRDPQDSQKLIARLPLDFADEVQG